jgi:predicted Kef-type K+ transport protein
MNSIAIVIAFAPGFAARQILLPPLVGYLVAAFAIKAGGVEGRPHR